MTEPSADRPPAQILLVDDDPSVLSGLRRVLRGQPWHVLCATSAAEALAICERERIDVVVSDNNMPEAKGIDLLEAVRQAHPHTARFMLTGQVSLGLALDAINRGAVTRFFEKPCDGRELVAAIHDVLSTASLGPVAGTVAHDLNNLLTVIEARNRLVLQRSDLEPELRQDAEVIQRVVQRSASLTRRLLGVTDPSPDDTVST